MNRILAKKYTCLKIIFNPCVIGTRSYQIQNELKKFRFKRQNDSFPSSFVNITDKTSCLEELKCMSTILIQDLKNIKWLRDLEDSNRQLRTLSFSNDLNSILYRHLKSNRLNAITEFVDTHFEIFLPSEKSFIFKLFSIVHQQQKENVKNEKLFNILKKLELDYYDNIEKCDLVDYSNYLDAFYLFRDSNIHFYTKSIDKIFRKILNELNTVNKSTDSKDVMLSMNRQWFETLKPDNSFALGVHILNRLSLLNSDAKSIYFYNLIGRHYERISSESVDVFASLMAYYNFSSNVIKLSNDNRKMYEQLLDKNQLNLIENIDKIKSNRTRTAVVDWLSRKNIHNELLDKYKTSLVNYFLNELKQARTVSEFTTAIKCSSLLINSNNRQEKNLKNAFYRIYEPIYNKLVDKFVRNTSITKNSTNSANDFESIINFKSTNCIYQNTNSRRANRKFMSRSLRDEIMNKYNSLYEHFDLYSFAEIIEAVQKGEFRWLANETMLRFQSNYSYNLNSMNKELRHLYLCEANRISKESSNIQLSKKVLDSILKEFVIANRDIICVNKNAQIKDICTTINLILNNHEYSVYKFNMLEPYILRLIDQDLQHIRPVIEPLMNDFYYDTFPGKTSNILNKVRNKICHRIVNFSDQDNTNLSDLTHLVNLLFKAKEKIKFDSNLSFDMSNLKKNLDKCLTEFDLLCGMSNNQSKMSKNEVRNLSDQVKQFETRIFKYTMALKHIANLILLSDDYNPRLLIQLTECVLKLLGIFYDNLFTKVIVDLHHYRKNYFTRNLICDLLTVFGLYNYFDLNFICRSLNPAEKLNFSQGIRELKLYNDYLYSIIKKNDSLDTLQLIDYNFSLLNLNIQSIQSTNDLFNNVQSFETLMQKFGHLNSVSCHLLLLLLIIQAS